MTPLWLRCGVTHIKVVCFDGGTTLVLSLTVVNGLPQTVAIFENLERRFRVVNSGYTKVAPSFPPARINIALDRNFPGSSLASASRRRALEVE